MSGIFISSKEYQGSAPRAIKTIASYEHGHILNFQAYPLSECSLTDTVNLTN